MPRRNPNPKTEHLKKTQRPKTPEGFVSAVLRIQVRPETLEALQHLHPKVRGEILDRWFKEQQ